MIQVLTDIVLTITGFQLLLLVVVLLAQAHGPRQQRNLLVAFLGTKAVLILRWALFRFELLTTTEWLYAYFISATGFYLLTPLLFLYVRALCYRQFRLRPKHLWHLLPGLIMAVYGTLYVLAFARPEATAFVWARRVRFWDPFWAGNFTQILAYLSAMVMTVRTYRRRLREEFSSVEKWDLTWLTYLFAVLTLHWIFVVTRGTLGLAHVTLPTFTALLDLFSITIFLVFTTMLVVRGLGQLKLLAGLDERPRYAAAALESNDLARLAEQLTAYMQSEKPHLRPSLTLGDLSEGLAVPTWQLSQVINRTFHQNFFNYVNGYRIEEAKARLQNPAHQRVTILEILLDVGFNSKSTFNEAFKRHTGMTPSRFKQLNLSEN